MSKPDFSSIFAQSGPVLPLSESQFLQGFGYLGDSPPTIEEFNWLFQEVWKRLQWLDKNTTGIWQAGRVYAVGEICKSSDIASYKYMECTVAGTSGATEPVWSAVGQTSADGTVTWIVRDVRAANPLLDGTGIANVADIITKGPVVDVRAFGAKGDSVTNDTTAIANAYANCAAGDSLLIPKGSYNITNLVFDKDDVFIDCRGTLIQDANATGSAVTFGNSAKNTFKNIITGLLRVKRVPKWYKVDAGSNVVDATHDSTGVLLLNTYESVMSVSVSGFKRGVLLKGDAKGCAYNTITIVDLLNNQSSLDTAIANGGWVNENLFIGGRYHWDSNIVNVEGSETPAQAFARIQAIHINIPDTTMNNNTFIKPSLEGYAGKFVYCNGQYNHFITPRLEGAGAIKMHFGAASLYNELFHPYAHTYIPTDTTFINEGSRNRIYARDTIDLQTTQLKAHVGKFIGNMANNASWGQQAVLEAQSTSSGADKAIAVVNPSGTVTGFVTGDGDAELQNVKAKKILECRNVNGNSSEALMVKSYDGATNVFGVRGDGNVTGRTKILGSYSSNFLIPWAVLTTAAQAPSGTPRWPDNSEAIGVPVFNSADSKLFIHIGGGVWKSVTLS